MESQTKNAQSRAQIAAMVARAFDGMTLVEGESAVRELKDGWFNAAYLMRLEGGRETVLKIAPPPGAEVMQYEKNIMLTEVDSMRLVGKNPDIPVPDIYFFDQSRELCNSDYFFMQKMDGDTLEQLKDSLTPGELAAFEEQVGALIRRVNGFPGTYFGYEGNPELRAGTWREAFLKIVEAALQDAERKQATFDYSTAIRG